jgi:DNA-directed RNA polymerase subunit RPC12/RpoP
MKKSDLIKVSFGEVQGLPLGVPDAGGNLVRKLSLHPWGWNEEVAIGKVRDDHPDLTHPNLVTEILARLIQTWGPYRFDDLDLEERKLRLRNSYMADVIFAYISLRVSALGPELIQSMRCANCRRDIEWEGSLLDLEVAVVEAKTAAELISEYRFKTPILLGKADCSWVKVRPGLWDVACRMPSSASGRPNDPIFRQAIFEDAVVDADGVEHPEAGMVMSQARLETLRKKDIETIARVIDEGTGGADIAFEFHCPHCKVRIFIPVRLPFDDFFGISSAS